MIIERALVKHRDYQAGVSGTVPAAFAYGLVPPGQTAKDFLQIPPHCADSRVTHEEVIIDVEPVEEEREMLTTLESGGGPKAAPAWSNLTISISTHHKVPHAYEAIHAFGVQNKGEVLDMRL